MLKKNIFICIALVCSLMGFSQESQKIQYKKNTRGDVVIEGKLEFPNKSKYSKIFLYEIKGNDEYILASANVINKDIGDLIKNTDRLETRGPLPARIFKIPKNIYLTSLNYDTGQKSSLKDKNIIIEALKLKDINNLNNNDLISINDRDTLVKFRQFY